MSDTRCVGGEGEQLAGQLDLHGAMVSLGGDGDGYERGRFIETLEEFVGACL